MDLPALISRTCPIQLLGVFGGISFYFCSNCYRTICKRTVETLIRRCILVWICSVSLCPTERTLGLYGLKYAVKTNAGPLVEPLETFNLVAILYKL